MKIEMQMTERDKKLIVFLAVFVVVVGLGYWVVRPMIINIIEINDEIEVQTQLADINELKLVELPMIEMDNEEFEQEILDARQYYYPMMSSNEIDKMMTGIALSYNLYSYDLVIKMPNETTKREAYQYSEKYALDQEAKRLAESEAMAELYAAESSGTVIEEYDAILDSAYNVESISFDDSVVGIYEVQVSMRLGGDEEDLQRLIDDYSVNDKEIQVVSYSWNDSEQLNYNLATEEYEFNTERVLNITISIYMCEE